VERIGGKGSRPAIGFLKREHFPNPDTGFQEYFMKVGAVLDLFKKDGWVLARTRGSHRQLRHPTKPGTVTVSGKPSLDLSPGTLGSILKQAGLK
jgi:predicted RNA binding protein YcfA (HicA-like mRNA interferase family)